MGSYPNFAVTLSYYVNKVTYETTLVSLVFLNSREFMLSKFWLFLLIIFKSVSCNFLTINIASEARVT